MDDGSVQQDDADLVSRSKAGDISAFNLIVERYQRQVYNLSARILGDRVTAEDVTQEAFISAYKAIGRFRGGSLRAWLLRIASNRCYDVLRTMRRRPEQSLDQSMENPGFSVPATGGSPEQEALKGELRAEIERAIVALPADQRTTLALIDVQGLSYDEAAEATGATVGTIKSRLSRARAGVRDTLLQNPELLPGQFRRVQ